MGGLEHIEAEMKNRIGACNPSPLTMTAESTASENPVTEGEVVGAQDSGLLTTAVPAVTGNWAAVAWGLGPHPFSH